MKPIMMAVLVAAQISLVAQPARAAGLLDERGPVAQRQGAFAGARLRIGLDGSQSRQARLGLALAPVTQGRQANGSMRTRFGEGVELRLSGAAAEPELAFGGRSLTELAQGRSGPAGAKAGISTIGWVAIGIGVAAAVVFTLGSLCADGKICGSDRDD